MSKKFAFKIAVISLLLTAINSCYYERESDQLKVCYVRSGSIWTMNIDGSEQTQITYPPVSAYDNAPSWSPDGRKILFHSDRDGNSEIFVINADGSGLKQLTHTSIPDTNICPTWSSDGKRIVFAGTRTPTSYVFIATTNANIIKSYNFIKSLAYPTLSPDDNYLYLTENTGAPYPFRRINLLTNNTNDIYETNAGYTSISISPDGKTIAATYTLVSHIHLWNETSYIDFLPNAYDPCWTPDGKTIVYISAGDIYRINIDGTNNKPLTTEGGCSSPCVQGKPK
ncbi:MAG TPA: hypothetical protein PK624_04290 [Spirochaetota bacterium]|nr:hypothetical protein [Spirochaetota bacterium]HOR43995.1 hypothetical protein [Spirochaetota bacterium]HPK56285.1 hypothetical protein [Spirochaetota bacterium]HQE60402.1 hypothetical protein [Spirochaetota bacterium]